MANKNKNAKKATNTTTLSADTTAQINDKSPQQIMEDFVREKLAPTDPPDYKILQNKSHVLLQTEVLNHLNEGWTLVGGVALATYVTPYEASLLFSQALAKNI